MVIRFNRISREFAVAGRSTWECTFLLTTFNTFSWLACIVDIDKSVGFPMSVYSAKTLDPVRITLITRGQHVRQPRPIALIYLLRTWGYSPSVPATDYACFGASAGFRVIESIGCTVQSSETHPGRPTFSTSRLGQQLLLDLVCHQWIQSSTFRVSTV